MRPHLSDKQKMRESSPTISARSMGTTDRKVRPRYRGMSMISSGTRGTHAPIKCTVEYQGEACVNVGPKSVILSLATECYDTLSIRVPWPFNLLAFDRLFIDCGMFLKHYSHNTIYTARIFILVKGTMDSVAYS